MLSDRELSERLQAQAAAELKVRKKVVLTVAQVLNRRTRAVEDLAKAEREVGAALQTAVQTMTLSELASLTGESLVDLRRLARAATGAGQPAEPAGPAGPESVGEGAAGDALESRASAAGTPPG